MSLELFNNLVNAVKRSDFVKNFINELQKSLEKQLEITEDNLITKTQRENKLTSEYRDKMNIEQEKILEDYANKTKELGTMYHVYNKTEDNYLISICDQLRSHEIIEINKNNMPEGACVNSILREKDGKYILDIEATNYLNNQIQNKLDELLKEQNETMNNLRQEGHIYEFVEKSGKTISLIDNTINSSNVFEEYEFDEEIFRNAQEGDLYKYENGMYQKI